MLVSFSVTNFRSIGSPASLSMRAATATKEFPNNCFPSKIGNVGPLLKSAAIYGANGAGKSNILMAFEEAHELITESHNQTHGDDLDYQPFLLGEKGLEKPTVVDIEFIVDGTLYNYVYSFSKNRIERETLSAFPNLLRQMWFDRQYVPARNHYLWKFGPNFKGENEVTRERTLANTLFFSKAAQDNNDQIKPLMTFFREKVFIGGENGSGVHTYDLISSEAGKKYVSEFIRDADIGATGLEVEERDFSADDTPEFMPKKLWVSMRNEPSFRFKAKTIYEVPNSKELVTLDLTQQESIGTRRLFYLAGIILKTLHVGGTLLVDELESRLHVKIVDYIIALFHDPEINTKNAQLIFTTHNPIILETSNFRRDQVWFANRSGTLETKLYNLSRLAKQGPKFRPVRANQNLLKGYLEGKFYDPPEPNPEALKRLMIEDDFGQGEFEF